MQKTLAKPASIRYNGFVANLQHIEIAMLM